MAESYLVQIDLRRFRENAATNGKEMTPEQVREWLRESGFREQPVGSWLCEGVSLELLDRSKMLSVKRSRPSDTTSRLGLQHKD